MKKLDIKVKKSSDFWIDFEGELSIYGFFKWRDSNSLSFFMDNIITFTWQYISLSKKYGIAMSVKSFGDIEHFEKDYLLYKSKFEDEREHNPMLFIHTLNNNWVFPSILFIDITKEPEKIVSINPLLKLVQVEDKKVSQSSSMPIKVALDIKCN